MRWLVRCLLSMLLFIPHVALASTIEATTRDGKTVVLSSDGTWKYKEDKPTSSPTGSFTKPDSATSVLKSQKGFLELWYDPQKWSTNSGLENTATEFSLKHTAGDAYFMAVVERIAVPLSSLRQLGLDNAKKAAPDASIVMEEERTVNGVKMLAIQIEATSKGIPFKYFNYYWSGKAGAVQLITFTGQNLFDDYRADLENLLNGVVVTKP